MNSPDGKIWLLFDSKCFGGIESHIYQLSLGLINHQQDVEVVFLTDYGNHPLKIKLKNKNIPFSTLGGSFASLYMAIKNRKPNIIHTHGYKAGIYGRLASKLATTTIVSTFHAGEIPQGKLALYDFIDRLSAGMSDKVFSVSEEISKRIYCENSVFDNFINDTEVGCSKGDQIAFVGRLSFEKAPDRFIEVAKSMPEKCFHIYGDGPMRQELISNAPKNVIFHGSQENMATVWPNIGLLVMPSRAEGLPMAALEALAWGIPVIANDVGAVKKLVKNHVNGWLIMTPHFSITLNQAIQEWALQNEVTRNRYQLASQKTIHDNFSAIVTIPKLLKHYQSACTD